MGYVSEPLPESICPHASIMITMPSLPMDLGGVFVNETRKPAPPALVKGCPWSEGKTKKIGQSRVMEIGKSVLRSDFKAL